jgi:parallel beta-helix repeat protein
MRKHVFSMVLFLLVISTLLLASEIRSAKADGTIYINADGSITPSTAPISTLDNVTYTFTGNINESIVVQRNSTVIDGAGYAIRGSGSGKGMDLESVNNVAVENVSISDFGNGIHLNFSSNITLCNNFASGCNVAIYLSNSASNTLFNNTVIQNLQGIILDSSGNNTLRGNYVTENPDYGIALFSSPYGVLIDNTILGNAGLGGRGIYVLSSPHDILSCNNVTSNYDGIVIDSSSGSVLFQNVIKRSIRSNFGVYGSSVNDYVNSIDTSNSADGRPIYYIVNQNRFVIDSSTHSSVGYLALVNCTGVEVKDLSLANVDLESMLLAYATNCVITRNNIVNNRYGIYFLSSSNNTLTGNNVTGATQYTYTGITLESSNNNTVTCNAIIRNNGGIHIDFSSDNVISLNNVTGNPGGIGLVSSPNNILLDNFVAGSTSWGIWLLGSSDDTVSGNNVTENSFQGIHLSSCFDDVVSDNKVIQNYDVGIYIGSDCSNVTVSGNNVTGNGEVGIALYHSSGNIVFANDIVRNCQGILLDDSSGNAIFGNNFINNTHQAAMSVDNSNVWDDGYPAGGNYWSDYAGLDLYSSLFQNQTGGDGIGDTPYVIEPNDTDRYPLMGPICYFEAGIWNGTSFDIDIVSNSTISDVLIDIANKTISFNVTGADVMHWFCRVTIPKIFIQDLWHGNYIVLLDNEQWPSSNWTDGSSMYIYFSYTYSESKVMIIPEFPYALAMLFFATFLTITLLKEKDVKARFEPVKQIQSVPRAYPSR